MWIYSNNGMTKGRWEDAGNVPDGHVFFDHEPTAEELAVAFKGHNAALKKQKLEEIRARRDQLLTESDRYMLLDYPIDEDQRERWKEYRQALRDMPESCDMNNPVWPTKPE